EVDDRVDDGIVETAAVGGDRVHVAGGAGRGDRAGGVGESVGVVDAGARRRPARVDGDDPDVARGEGVDGLGPAHRVARCVGGVADAEPVVTAAGTPAGHDHVVGARVQLALDPRGTRRATV